MQSILTEQHNYCESFIYNVNTYTTNNGRQYTGI